MVSIQCVLAVAMFFCSAYRTASAADENPLGLTEVRGKQYWVGNYTKVDFYEAKRRCALYGMDLVSINSQEKYDIVINEVLLGSDERYWTSGNKINDQKTWVWARGTPVTYTHWGPGEPNNEHTSANENCIEIITKNFNDLECAKLDYFVCEEVEKCKKSCATIRVNCGSENDSCSD